MQNRNSNFLEIAPVIMERMPHMVFGKQRYLYAVAALFLLVGQVSAFAGGNGTASNPYEISNVDQLQNMSSNLTAHYELVNHINASETETWNSGTGFEPIGNYSNKFRGTLDGQGHQITGLYINNSDSSQDGLFAYIGNADVRNLALQNATVTSKNSDYAGAIAGGMNSPDSTISNVYTTGTVSASISAGGIVGYVDEGNIKNTYSRVNVSSDDYAGGIFGDGLYGSLSKTYSTGTVSGPNAGGLIGRFAGSVSDSYWDKEASEISSSGGGTGLTTGEMTGLSSRSNMSLDYTDTWALVKNQNQGYPFLETFCGTSFNCSKPPKIDSVELQINENQSEKNLVLDLSSKWQQDISSYQGLSSVSTFTNTSLEGEFSFPFNSSISVEDSTGLVSGSRSVDLERNDSGHRADPQCLSFSTQCLNQTYTISNEGNDSVNYSLSLEIPGTVDSKQQWNGTLNPGSSTTHTVESHGDWIQEELYKFDVPGKVTIGEDFTGTQALEVAEQANVSWENISTSDLVNVPGSCSQENLTEISVPAGMAENKTIGFSCSSGSIGPATDSLYDHGDYEKAWYNTTLTVDSNLTENSSLTWPVNKSELPRFSSRNPGSIKAVVNGKSEDVAVVEEQDKIYVTVQDDFGNSSLHKGQHSASLTYTIPDNEPETGNESENSITFSEEQYNTVIPGTTSTLLFTAFNYEEEPNQLYLETRDTRACQYFTVQTSYTGDEYGKQSSLRIPAGNSGTNGTGDVVLKAKVDVPNRSKLLEEGLGDTFTCRFQTGAGIGEAESLNLTVKLVDQKPPVVQAVEELLPDLPETSFIVEKEVCLPEGGEESSRLEQVQTFMEKDRCSGNLYSIPWLTGNGWMITVAGIVFVVGLRRFY